LKELEPIVNNLKNTATGGSWANITGTNPMNWLKKFINSDCSCTKEPYYTYVGSLTTPPCTENVIWIVMENPHQLGTNQVNFS